MSTIADLNDRFRTAGYGPGWLITRGVTDRSAAFQLATKLAVQRFSDFTDVDDDHDLGWFLIAGEKLYWRIVYYDIASQERSPDPTDPATNRVLVIMLASEARSRFPRTLMDIIAARRISG